jgi:hypothetical protein
VALNRILHDNPPPISSHHLISDPRDLLFHKVNTYWPNFEPKWWKGTVTHVDMEARELRIEYIKPWPSSAYIPLDYYGWYVPYYYKDVDKWSQEAPFLASNQLNIEIQRRENVKDFKKKHLTSCPGEL